MLVDLSYRYPHFSYRKIQRVSQGAGQQISREGVRLIRNLEGLQVLKKQKKKRLLGQSTARLKQAEFANHVWRYDFVHNRTEDDRRVKYLTIMDELTHEILICLDRTITSTRLISCLGYLFKRYEKPACIKSDNGPEFTAYQLQYWLKANRVDERCIEPGSLW